MKPTEQWTDKDWVKLDSWLHDMLRATTVTVEFTKKDGTPRTMKCTLQESVVPEVKGTGKKKAEELVTVFDTEINEWRSFGLRSIKRISLLLESKLEIQKHPGVEPEYVWVRSSNGPLV